MKIFSVKSAKAYGLWNEILCAFYKMKAYGYSRKLKRTND